MTLGFGLFAMPNQYDATGRNSYQVSNAGTIYQADGGPSNNGGNQPTDFNPTPSSSYPAWIVSE